MLRTPVSKKNSIRVVTIVLAVIALMTIWPLRLYHETMSCEGGKVTEISADVTAAEDAGEYFTAQYDHLESIEVYIESVTAGEYFTAQLFDQSDGANTQLALEKVAFPDEDLPGYVTIPMDVDLTPGNVYILILSGQVRKEEPSTFRVGFESAQEAAANPKAPIYNVAFHHDTGISGLALSMRTHYDEPLTKAKSALACGLIAALTVVALILQQLWFKRFPSKERLIPLLSVLQVTLTPVIVIPAVLGVIAVFPLRLYDSRIMDILIYEAGIILAALFLLYGLWHDRTGVKPWFEDSTDLMAHGTRILMALDVAWIMQNACTYMNAVNDYVHHDCEARITIGLVLLIFLLGKLRWTINPWTILTALVSALAGVRYVRNQYVLITSADAVREVAEQMRNVISRAVSMGFLVVGAVSVIVMLAEVLREPKADRHAGRAAHGVHTVLILFLTLACLCRNGRTWITLLTSVWILLYLRYAYSTIRERSQTWLRIVSYGILLHFGYTVIWTMLHRYYLAYNYSRFSMQFHTVTITAYYLLIVSATALSLFLMKLRSVWELPRKEQLRHMWKEIGVLGTVCSYMLMSMTRAGVYALVIMVLVGIAVTFHGMTGAWRKMLKSLGLTIMVSILTFPSIFTGQRLVSTMVADPVIYAPVEEYFDVLMRHTPWNSTEFMNIEIFLRDSLDRVVGGGLGSQIYYRLRWNIPQGYDTARAGEEQLFQQHYGIAQGPLVAAVSDDVIANITTGNYTGDGFSNGRTAIWRAYLEQMNLTGHEGMDITLENGEIAIHAHNMFIQTAYDCGAPAGVLFGLLVVLTLYGSWVYYREHCGTGMCVLMPLLAMVGFAFTGMVEWIFQFNNPYTIVFLMILAPLLYGDTE